MQFLTLLSESSDESSQNSDQEIALSKAIDAILLSMEKNSEFSKSKDKHHEYAQERREKCSVPEVQSNIEAADKQNAQQETYDNVKNAIVLDNGVECEVDDLPAKELSMLSYERKVAVLYELLSACMADIQEENKTSESSRKGYDARHRLTLRLLSSWFDLKWMTMVCMLIRILC